MASCRTANVPGQIGERFIGIDIGAETIKLAELVRERERLRCARVRLEEHEKDPARILPALLEAWEYQTAAGVAVCGRLARLFALPRVPEKLARAAGFRLLCDDQPATLVSIGSHGFSVLELREHGIEILRENSRCSQGTGNFLRQLVERFKMTVEEASARCATVPDPAPLSGRCPVILKTDMTHLANAGQSHDRILAGLFDAVGENVQVLIKPRLSPPRIALLGGVSRAPRIREHFRRHAERNGMRLLQLADEQALFMDAIGCAVLAARAEPRRLPGAGEIREPIAHANLETLPPLTAALARVRRHCAAPLPTPTDRGQERVAALVLGLDIGSTGSKAVAIDADDGAMIWQTYTATGGDPVGATRRLIQAFVDGPCGARSVLLAGATGSGREIVGSLLITCFGAERVFVLNEIAAHAAGALHHDPRVDTIFEIGGQDAKYIRLAEGRVVDAAMNEACSAGTGSFIEEQGRRFAGVRDIAHLGRIALDADAAVSLGQHCSVFMAEIIDEATASGVAPPRIIAGIFESIVQNYLNRVKGGRTVGEVVFCQGMPFSSDALAAAVARQTGAEVIVPPHPGTIGALGIALLARQERPEALAVRDADAALPLARFLEARVVEKDQFVCRSVKGCGGTGNKCRINRLKTQVEGGSRAFTWGGACSLYDRGTGLKKLPDGAPDPFREREELVDRLIATLPPPPPGAPRVAITDEFALKNLFPFFATFLAGLGAGLRVLRAAEQKTLKRGIEEANIPFCAPMQLYHGVISLLAEEGHDFLFLPMLISSVPVQGEARSVLCPIVEGSADLNRWDLAARNGNCRTRILSPLLDIRVAGLRSRPFLDGLAALAAELGATGTARRASAIERALAAQEAFDRDRDSIGRRALSFAEERGIDRVVVLGRDYTIYSTVLNSNVPAILREQGAMAVPVDCYPVAAAVPLFADMYWGYGQRNLRAAHQIRRTPGISSVWCSNYACGPDSFTLHLYSYLTHGSPHTVIETDGHSGDAGTRTRIEAFLHCVREERRAAEHGQGRPAPTLNDLGRIEAGSTTLGAIRERRDTLLIPRLGPASEPLAALMQGLGIPAECLPTPDNAALAIGRRHTSGKECVPLAITIGSLLQRLQAEADPEARFAFLMPGGRGPCRFGLYNILDKIVLERLGWSERVRVWSPRDEDYFEGIDAGVTALVFSGIMAADLLLAALHDVRPAETTPGAAAAIYDRYRRELNDLIGRAARGDLSAGRAVAETARGTMFGCAGLLQRAGREFRAARHPGELPTVLVIGEIFVRCDPFANDWAVDKLQAQGVRVRLAPFNEWLDYQEYINPLVGIRHDIGSWFSAKVQARIQHRSHGIMAAALGWAPLSRAAAAVEAAAPYVRYPLEGEAVLTLGGALHEWERGGIDGVLSLAPLECMPSKIAEAQLVHAAEREGVRSLTLALNGDPVDPQIFENFVFEVRERFRLRMTGRQASPEHPRQRLLPRVGAIAREICRGFPLNELPGLGRLQWRAPAETYATPPCPSRRPDKP